MDSIGKKILIIIVVASLWGIMFSVDKYRVSKKQKPWFCIPIETNELGTGTYYGLFYKASVLVTNENDKKNIEEVTLSFWFENIVKDELEN